jgi:hypothetical protein
MAFKQNTAQSETSTLYNILTLSTFNIHTSTCRSVLITQRYLFRPNWSSSGVKVVGLEEPAALLCCYNPK